VFYGGTQWWGEVFLDEFPSVWFLLRDCREVSLSKETSSLLPAVWPKHVAEL